MSDDNPEGFPWDEEVLVLVTFRVLATPDPEYYDGPPPEKYGGARTPMQAALTAAYRTGVSLANTDGFADLIGEVDVIHVEPGY